MPALVIIVDKCAKLADEAPDAMDDTNAAADPINATQLRLAQLPRRLRRGVLVRADSGGGTHGFLDWLTARFRRLHYSVGITITEDMQAAPS
jgi:hypothetical protein